MGLFKSNEEKQAELHQEVDAELAAVWPAREPPYVEWLHLPDRKPEGFVTFSHDVLGPLLRGRLRVVHAIGYLGQVGIQPEDVYAVCPTQDGGCDEVGIIYRDRPEYAAGRERYWQWAASR